MKLETGDVVLCTVEKIAGTTVFVNVTGHGQGTIILSEIAPGRIRNIRDYVVPKKTIVCKILKISERSIELSLRRVTPKEQKEVKEQYKQEKSYKSILKSILKENVEKVINQILEEDTLHNFLEDSKKDSKQLEKLIGLENSKKVLAILNAQKQKKAILKKEVFLHTVKPNGIIIIKEILKEIKDAEVKYVSAGKYSLKVEMTDLKKADNKIKEILEEIEKKANKKEIEFSHN